MSLLVGVRFARAKATVEKPYDGSANGPLLPPWFLFFFLFFFFPGLSLSRYDDKISVGFLMVFEDEDILCNTASSSSSSSSATCTVKVMMHHVLDPEPTLLDDWLGLR